MANHYFSPQDKKALKRIGINICIMIAVTGLLICISVALG